MSNGQDKYEVSAVAQKAGCAWLHEPLAQRFATICRAPLVAEVEQAKKDAKRYRWLVSQPNGGFFHPVFAVNSLLSWKSKDQYDAAIDAAIARTKEQP